MSSKSQHLKVLCKGGLPPGCTSSELSAHLTDSELAGLSEFKVCMSIHGAAPAPPLSSRSALDFKVILPMSYPSAPPVIRAANSMARTHLANVVSSASKSRPKLGLSKRGDVQLPMLRTGRDAGGFGWQKCWTIQDALYALRSALLSPSFNYITAVHAHVALASQSTATPAVLRPHVLPSHSRQTAGVCERQGARATMEDKAITGTALALPAPYTLQSRAHVLGIFDGHGSAACSTHVAACFAQHLADMVGAAAAEATNAGSAAPAVPSLIAASMEGAFRAADEDFLRTVAGGVSVSTVGSSVTPGEVLGSSRPLESSRSRRYSAAESSVLGSPSGFMSGSDCLAAAGGSGSDVPLASNGAALARHIEQAARGTQAGCTGAVAVLVDNLRAPGSNIEWPRSAPFPGFFSKQTVDMGRSAQLRCITASVAVPASIGSEPAAELADPPAAGTPFELPGHLSAATLLARARCIPTCGAPGSTCLVVAHVGDSRAVLVLGCGADGYALELTEDHQPKFSRERARIGSAGGAVIGQRILGKLAVSRAFGDPSLRLGENNCELVTPEPDVLAMTVPAGAEALILACDGLWDVMSAGSAAALVRCVMWSKLKGDSSASSETIRAAADAAAAALADTALALGSSDNVSALVLPLAVACRPPTPGHMETALFRAGDTLPSVPSLHISELLWDCNRSNAGVDWSPFSCNAAAATMPGGQWLSPAASAAASWGSPHSGAQLTPASRASSCPSGTSPQSARGPVLAGAGLAVQQSSPPPQMQPPSKPRHQMLGRRARLAPAHSTSSLQPLNHMQNEGRHASERCTMEALSFSAASQPSLTGPAPQRSRVHGRRAGSSRRLNVSSSVQHLGSAGRPMSPIQTETTATAGMGTMRSVETHLTDALSSMIGGPGERKSRAHAASGMLDLLQSYTAGTPAVSVPPGTSSQPSFVSSQHERRPSVSPLRTPTGRVSPLLNGNGDAAAVAADMSSGPARRRAAAGGRRMAGFERRVAERVPNPASAAHTAAVVSESAVPRRLPGRRAGGNTLDALDKQLFNM